MDETQFKNLVDVHYHEAKMITLVMDNLITHTGASLYKAFAPEEARRILDKLDIHYTPNPYLTSCFNIY